MLLWILATVRSSDYFQYLLFLLGLTVKESGKHRQYQANLAKRKNILSNQFIGFRAFRDKDIKLLKAALGSGYSNITNAHN